MEPASPCSAVTLTDQRSMDLSSASSPSASKTSVNLPPGSTGSPARVRPPTITQPPRSTGPIPEQGFPGTRRRAGTRREAVYSANLGGFPCQVKDTTLRPDDSKPASPIPPMHPLMTSMKPTSVLECHWSLSGGWWLSPSLSGSSQPCQPLRNGCTYS
jgi:hypothetical protein